MHPTIQEVLFLLGRSHLRCKEVPIDALIYEAVVSILGRRTTAHIDRDLGAEDRGLGKRKLGEPVNESQSTDSPMSPMAKERGSGSDRIGQGIVKHPKALTPYLLIL